MRGSDVVYSNLRGDQPAKLRLTYDDLKDVNPRIVCCSLSGFGMTGPRAAAGRLRLHDARARGLDEPHRRLRTARRPRAACRSSTSPAATRRRSPCSPGLWRARRDGVGCDCDVSLLDTALHELMYVGTWAASRGYVPPRRRNSAHPSIVPFQNFETADGWIVVACPKEKFWALLCDAIGRPGAGRASSRPSPTATGAATSCRRSSTRSSASGRARSGSRCSAAAGVPCSPVNDVPAALEEARLVEYEHPRLGHGAAGRVAAAPVRTGAAACGRARRGVSTRSRSWSRCADTSRSGFARWPGRGVFGVESKGDRDAEASAAT